MCDKSTGQSVLTIVYSVTLAPSVSWNNVSKDFSRGETHQIRPVINMDFFFSPQLFVVFICCVCNNMFLRWKPTHNSSQILDSPTFHLTPSWETSPPPSCWHVQPSFKGCNCGCLEGNFEGSSPCSPPLFFPEGASVRVAVFEKLSQAICC